MPSAIVSLDRRFQQIRADRWEGEWSLSDVVDHLNASGIPTLVDRNALDDEGISLSDNIEFDRANLRLPDRLAHALGQLNLGWTVTPRGNAILISSRSGIDEALLTVTYDVTPVIGKQGFQALKQAINHNIAPDSWDDFGGPGSISSVELRGRSLIVVSQRYEVHQRLHRMLNSIHRLGGQSNVLPELAQAHAETSMGTVSTPIRMPSHPKRRGINLPGSGSESNMGAFGGGMMGGMGGMF